jgi:hypothetical protein
MKRYLRAVAVALILLPEPFTTPFGIFILLLSFMLPKRHKDSIKNLETLMRKYLCYTHSLNSNQNMKYQNYNNNRVNYHVTPLHSYIDKKNRAQFQHQYLFDSHKVNDRVIHHVLKTSISQYEMSPGKNLSTHTIKPKLPNSGEFYSSLRPVKPTAQIKTQYHSLKRC